MQTCEYNKTDRLKQTQKHTHTLKRNPTCELGSLTVTPYMYALSQSLTAGIEPVRD